MTSLRPGRRLSTRAAVLAFAALAIPALGACSSAPRVVYSPNDLRSEVAERVPVERIGEIVVPYEPTPAMIARAKKYTEGPTTEYTRAELLVRAVTDTTQFGLRWERVATTVASRTLENGHGNCLSLTSLYVGLARAIGLSAYYVDASDRINDLTRADELIVDTGHIAASVRTERGWSLVDFTGEISQYRTFRVIGDVEALAHFYNNRGYEKISVARSAGEETPWAAAQRDFEMATYVFSDFARAQNNLGVTKSRLDDEAAAEAAYLSAVAADKDFAAPRHNLGNLYLRRKNFDQAIRWYSLAIKLQRNNPYTHYHLGLALYQSGDIAGSIDEFERAIALKHDYIEPRNLLAQAYRQQGRMEEAERVRQAAQQ